MWIFEIIWEVICFFLLHMQDLHLRPTVYWRHPSWLSCWSKQQTFGFQILKGLLSPRIYNCLRSCSHSFFQRVASLARCVSASVRALHCWELLHPHPAEWECLASSFVLQTGRSSGPVALVKTVIFLSWMELLASMMCRAVRAAGMRPPGHPKSCSCGLSQLHRAVEWHLCVQGWSLQVRQIMAVAISGWEKG